MLVAGSLLIEVNFRRQWTSVNLFQGNQKKKDVIKILIIILFQLCLFSKFYLFRKLIQWNQKSGSKCFFHILGDRCIIEVFLLIKSTQFFGNFISRTNYLLSFFMSLLSAFCWSYPNKVLNVNMDCMHD